MSISKIQEGRTETVAVTMEQAYRENDDKLPNEVNRLHSAE